MIDAIRVWGEQVFTALADGTRQTKAQLVERTGLAKHQVTAGWLYVSRVFGLLAVMEPHRQNSVYYLANSPTELGVRRYRYWRGQHVFTRLHSDLYGLEDAIHIGAQRGEETRHLDVGRRGLLDAIAAMRTEVRLAGAEADIPTAEVEAWMVKAAERYERDGASTS